MNPLDENLRAALRPVEPSPDFADRVLARVALEAPAPATNVVILEPRRRATWLAAAAAAVLVATSTGLYVAGGREAAHEVTMTTKSADETTGTLRQGSIEVPPATAPSLAVNPTADVPTRSAIPRRSPRPPRQSDSVTRERDIALGLEAKAQLMRALSVTAGALNAVNRSVTAPPAERPAAHKPAGPAAS